MGYAGRNAIGALLAALFLAGAAQAEEVNVPFTFDWNGFPLGKAHMTYSDTDATYEARLEGKSNGFGTIFSPLTTTTTAQGRLTGGLLHPGAYDTTYQLRVKRKEVHLRWNAAGVMTEDRVVPAMDADKRPAVSAAQKAGAVDPLSGFWMLRQWAGSASAGATKDIKVWDGRRLFTLKATHETHVTWRLSGPPIPAHLVRVRRIGLAGFKPEEQAALEAGREPELLFYFAAGNTGPVKDLEPVGMEISAVLGTIHAVRSLPMAAPVAPVQSRSF